MESPKQPRNRRPSKRVDSNPETTAVITVQQQLKQTYYSILDNVTNTINDRFDQQGLKVYQAIEELVLSSKADTGSSTISIKDLYQLYCLDQQLLETELDMLVMDLDMQGCSNVVEFIDKFKANIVSNHCYYPLLEQFLRVVLLLPATNASSERSFSALKRLKTALRNSMGQASLNSLLIMHVYKELTDILDIQKIISRCVMCHGKRRERDIAINLYV